MCARPLGSLGLVYATAHRRQFYAGAISPTIINVLGGRAPAFLGFLNIGLQRAIFLHLGVWLQSPFYASKLYSKNASLCHCRLAAKRFLVHFEAESVYFVVTRTMPRLYFI